ERLPAQMEMIPPEDILLVGFRNPELRHLTGSTLAEVAPARRVSPEIAAMDLIAEDDSLIDTLRSTMIEDTVRRALQTTWFSICSDAGSIAPEPPFTHRQPHPRAYGTFARVLGRYVREQGVLPLEEAIHRMSGLPAARLGLTDRGLLRPGFAADIVVFDPRT